MPTRINENIYSAFKSRSVREKLLYAARMKVYDSLCRGLPLHELSSVIDVGVTADKEHRSSNFFIKSFPYSDRITAFSDQDASWMEDEYKGLVFVQGDGLDMPFDDHSFDLVFSSAVIEHVGSRDNQRQFIRECIRVAKKYVFITTPNRWYPLELHTGIPFIHYFPPKMYRKILRFLKKNFHEDEANLNLLSRAH